MFSTSRLRDKLAPSEKYKAKMILEGYNRIGCDAINVGAYDLSAGLPFLKSLIDSTTIPFISANLVEVSSGELSFEPYLLIEHEPFTIGVIGVSNLLPTTVKELRQEDYLEAGKSYIDKLKEKADIIVGHDTDALSVWPCLGPSWGPGCWARSHRGHGGLWPGCGWHSPNGATGIEQ